MSKFLITPSLLSSYQYYIKDEWRSPEDSRADFLRTLSRERFEPNEAMQKGIDFENDIMNASQSSFDLRNFEDSIDGDLVFCQDKEYDLCVLNFAKIVEGGLWQQTCKKDLQVGNNTFLLYGRMDVVKRDTIYDIKFTSKGELGKFLNSSQHLIYLYCSGLPKFRYLISDGTEFWVEDYVNDGTVENRIKSMISDFMGYLENDKEAKEMFLTKWESK